MSNDPQIFGVLAFDLQPKRSLDDLPTLMGQDTAQNQKAFVAGSFCTVSQPFSDTSLLTGLYSGQFHVFKG